MTRCSSSFISTPLPPPLPPHQNQPPNFLFPPFIPHTSSSSVPHFLPLLLVPHLPPSTISSSSSYFLFLLSPFSPPPPFPSISSLPHFLLLLPLLLLLLLLLLLSLLVILSPPASSSFTSPPPPPPHISSSYPFSPSSPFSSAFHLCPLSSFYLLFPSLHASPISSSFASSFLCSLSPSLPFLPSFLLLYSSTSPFHSSFSSSCFPALITSSSSPSPSPHFPNFPSAPPLSHVVDDTALLMMT